jgi:hypothetical protein
MFVNVKDRFRMKGRRTGRQQITMPMQGSLDIVSPVLDRAPGTASVAINFEPDLNGGFRRVDGYERFDGQAAPSAATWWAVELSDASDREPGETLTATGGASGVIVMIEGNIVAITAFNGTSFVVGASTNGGGTVVAQEILGGQMPGREYIEVELAAQDYYRSLIAAMPGSGPVRGVCIHLDKVYAFRDNIVASLCVPYKATASGWAELTLFRYLPFDAGTSPFAYGEAVTSSGSGVGVIRKCVKTDGQWDANDASGILVVEVTAGSFLNNEVLTGAAGGGATANGNADPIVINPGGIYQFASFNFNYTGAGFYAYGCNGVDWAFEIDNNDVLTPIITGSTVDTPKYLAVHKNHLILAIKSSLLHIAPGNPFNMDGAAGFGEINIGADITGMRQQPGEILLVATQRSTWGLYGTNATTDPFRPEIVSPDAGAYHYSFVSLGYPFGLNDQGVVATQRVQAYGNFEASTVTRLIQPIIDSKKLAIVGASVLRKRNQLRFFFNDATVLVIGFSMTAEGLAARATILQLEHTPTCVYNGATGSGDERLMFGATDGMVYEMGKGFTSDDETLGYLLRLNAFSPLRNKRQEFHLYGVSPVISCSDVFTLRAAYEMSYGSDTKNSSAEVQRQLRGGGGYYDIDNYDAMFYDVAPNQVRGFPMRGQGTAVALIFSGEDRLTKSFVLESVILDLSPRAQLLAY